MISLLRRIFFDNWLRKLISLILAIIVWVIVSHSMSSQRTVHNIPIKIVNLSKGKTIEGLQKNGLLNQKVSLTLWGNQQVLENLTGNDLQVVIDAKDRNGEWIASITKKNLVSLNPNFDVAKSIFKVAYHDIIVKLSRLISAKVPVLITQPVGEPPKGFQFLDIWPYHLHVSVTGPEETVRKLKEKGLKLTLNLGDISAEELESSLKNSKKNTDEISFFVPDSWKKLSVPYLSEAPIIIDDPKAKSLRMDFIKRDLIALNNPIPVSLFFPLKYSRQLNPSTTKLKAGGLLEQRNGLYMITTPLFAKGVSRLFVETVKEMLEISVVAAPNTEKTHLGWNIQFIYPHELEDRYISKVLMDYPNDGTLNAKLREEYLRNRFRSFMNSFRLYTNDEEKLSLKIQLENDIISIDTKKPFPNP